MLTLFFIFLFGMMVFAVLAAIAMFINTAMILLPWTVAATSLGAFVGYLVAMKGVLPDVPRPLLGGFVTLVLVLGFGAAGLTIFPPDVPPPVPVNEPFDFPKPNNNDLTGMMPIHMGISAIIGAVGVAAVLGCTHTKRLVLEFDDEPFGGTSRQRKISEE